MSEEEHDLRKSEDAVGQLLPIIKDAHGKIVDGLHRKATDPEWREEVREDIKTEEDYWKARAHLNYSRRNAQEARDEKLTIVNSLAEFYQKQGLRIYGDTVVSYPQQRSVGDKSPPLTKPAKNEVLDAVIKALDGAIPESWIRHNIKSKYLQKQERKSEYDFAEPDDKPAPYFGKKEKAIDYLKDDKATVAYRYGTGFVERLESEMKEDLKKDPEFRREVREDIQDKKAKELAISWGEHETEETPENTVDSALDQLEEIAKTIDPKKLRANPDIMRKHAYMSFLSLLHKYKFPCEVCGNTKIVRECGHDF